MFSIFKSTFDKFCRYDKLISFKLIVEFLISTPKSQSFLFEEGCLDANLINSSAFISILFAVYLSILISFLKIFLKENLKSNSSRLTNLLFLFNNSNLSI